MKSVHRLRHMLKVKKVLDLHRAKAYILTMNDTQLKHMERLSKLSPHMQSLLSKEVQEMLNKYIKGGR